MSEQEKKRQRISDFLYAETKPKFVCLPYTKQRKNFYRKRVFKEMREWRIEQKKKKKKNEKKKRLLNCFRYDI